MGESFALANVTMGKVVARRNDRTRTFNEALCRETGNRLIMGIPFPPHYPWHPWYIVIVHGNIFSLWRESERPLDTLFTSLLYQTSLKLATIIYLDDDEYTKRLRGVSKRYESRRGHR